VRFHQLLVQEVTGSQERIIHLVSDSLTPQVNTPRENREQAQQITLLPCDIMI
jgi:hypothetical protein